MTRLLEEALTANSNMWSFNVLIEEKLKPRGNGWNVISDAAYSKDILNEYGLFIASCRPA